MLDDGSLIELVYSRLKAQTMFAVSRKGNWTLEPSLELPTGERLVPFSPTNNLIRNQVVLLPEEPAEYSSNDLLVEDVRRFIHHYVDLSPTFERVATYYVLLSWVYDAFNEIPYLRLRGDFGTGKTRVLQILGSICYKAFFASGASTVSPIFHTLDAFRGTLIFDEADFRFSDESAQIVKVLNNGNVRGMPVLRTMMNRQKEFNPTAFQVFGPKIVATRGSYDDKGLESRFLTEEMSGRSLRSDIPLNLPSSFAEEALALRNQLLLYRFRNRNNVSIDQGLADATVGPRLNQILLPLLSIIEDEQLKQELKEFASHEYRSLLSERSLLVEAHVLEAIVFLTADDKARFLSIGAIVGQLNRAYGDQYDRPLTHRWVGSILRKRLHLPTYKSHGVYGLPVTDRSKIAILCERYGVDPKPAGDNGEDRRPSVEIQ